tara:strand:- start:2045 stop:2431 length:387 start_codon:yes stop_codon:yes gene_type:complete
MNLINAQEAPAAIGPYSHAVNLDGLVFCSGQLPLDPTTMKLVDGDVADQTRQIFSNMATVLKASDSSMGQVVKTIIFLADMADFPIVNGLYAEAFGDHKPARSTVQVAGLPLGALIEIECVSVSSAKG